MLVGALVLLASALLNQKPAPIYADLHIGGKGPYRFLVDTGASDIVLDPADAQRLGIDLGSLTFDRPFGSANGIGYGAKTVVGGLSVGPIAFTNVEVAINKTRMGSSLLGMAFLKRLKSYSVSGGKLVLRW